MIELVDTKEVRGSMQHFYSSRVEATWALVVLGIDGSDGKDEDDGQASGSVAA